MEKRIFFHWSTENKSWPELLAYRDRLETSLLPECRWLYPATDFVFTQDPAKSTQQFLRQKHSRLHSCWWMRIIFSRSQSFRLLLLGYPAGFGVRRSTTSACKSTGPERGKQKQVKGSHHWDSSKIHCTVEKNDWMRLESRMEARISTFSANCCDWISISFSETCGAYCLFCTFGTPNTL